MIRKNIPAGSPFEKSIGFSRAVRVGNFISVSGTAPLNPDGTTAQAGNLYGQTKTCIEIMKKAIEQAGASLSHVIRTRIMLADISKWEQAAQAHGDYFSEIRPVCTFVEVKGFIQKDWMIEMEMDCIVS